MLVLIAIVMYVMLRYSNVVMFVIGITYMFSGIWARAAYGWSRRRRTRASAGPADLLDEETDKRDSPRFQ
jgi:CDP-diacylglycerol--serine O-phosphatidyltransferase